MTKLLFLLSTLYCCGLWAQSSQTMTQIQSHTQLLNSGQGDVARSIRFAASSEVQMTVRSNHNAIERGVQALSQTPLSNQARQAAYESIRNASQRISAYQGLLEALNNRLGGANVTAERMRAQMGGNAPAQLSQRVHNIVNRYNQNRSNPTEFTRYLRSVAQPARAAAPPRRGGPPGTQVPDVVGGSVSP